jgi:hypothetical protein
LREDPPEKTPTPNLMERAAQFGERIIRFAKKIPRGANHPENNSTSELGIRISFGFRPSGFGF